MRKPEQCEFRTPLDGAPPEQLARCGLVSQLVGVREDRVCIVARDACEACCRSLETAEALNPVIASLVYRAACDVERAGGLPGCDAERARLLRQRAANHLAFTSASASDRCFPPDDPRPGAAETGSPLGEIEQPSELRWMVGMLTAPRDLPTVQQTLTSLQAAGFPRVDIFAEPGSWLPRAAGGQRVTVHPRRLGNFANFYTTLATLYERAPDADAYAVFQDDIGLAQGTRAWCEEQFWPLGAGLVSLFTSRHHARPRPGWHLLSPGLQRIFGGQAFVFRRDILRRFLADPLVIHALESGIFFDDQVVGAWAARQRLPIAYHTPSLVQHIGVVSSLFPNGPNPRIFATAVDHVEQLSTWQPPVARLGKIGLAGWHTPSGVGYQNYDLARHLKLERWLAPLHPSLPRCARPKLACPIEYTTTNADPRTMRRWMQGLDWVLFVETPPCSRLVQTANGAGVNVACLPNWEQLHPRLDWLSFIDLMICPSRHTYRHACDWKNRYGFGWEVIYAPCPIDTEAFRFRLRTRCHRFLFVNGWGGQRPRRLDGSRTPYSRKGAESIIEAAWAAPDLPFIVYSQVKLDKLPSNAELRKAPADHRRLYADGDVCVQPSHYEGIGLPLLECQASGMPLVTTDAPPMNEHEPLDVIPVRSWDIVQLIGDQPIASQVMEARDLVEVLRRWHGADIREASRKARQFIEREHSWTQFRQVVEAKLVTYRS